MIRALLYFYRYWKYIRVLYTHTHIRLRCVSWDREVREEGSGGISIFIQSINPLPLHLSKHPPLPALFFIPLPLSFILLFRSSQLCVATYTIRFADYIEGCTSPTFSLTSLFFRPEKNRLIRKVLFSVALSRGFQTSFLKLFLSSRISTGILFSYISVV